MAKTYTVKKGDTLSQIALDHLGDASKYKYLAQINDISNPNLIYVGQVIKLEKDSSSGSSSSSSTKKTNSKQVTINQFGLQSDTDRTLFVTWSWSKSNTASYTVRWYYSTGDGVLFHGSDESVTTFKQAIYNAPSNAIEVRVYVKPISKTRKRNGKTTNYWTAEWSTVKTYSFSDNPPTTPSTPSVKIDEKNKYKLIAELENLDVNAQSIQFQIVKNNTSVFNTGTANIITGHASYSCTVDPGGEYKVCCRSVRDKLYSDWSDYSNNVSTIPNAPSGIKTIKATSETSVYLEWEAAAAATSYDIEYTTEKRYFENNSDGVQPINGIDTTSYEKTGLETGQEYFFRVRSVNSAGTSPWSEIKSVVIGDKPAAPTTWSSTTTVITGDKLTLYWVHNTGDGSSQTYADLELYVDGFKETYTIKNTEDEDEKDKTSFYEIDTSEYIEGTKIEWRVRTAGITKVYGEWSVQRTIDVYAPPTLSLSVTDIKSNVLESLTTFPFYIYALAGPNTQTPIGYHLTITANEIYEAVDQVGNVKTISAGDQVYSKYFDIKDSLLVEMSANNIDLENGVEYTVTCVVTMDSGLNAEASVNFTVNWADDVYTPDAEIGYDDDTLVTYIRPYCMEFPSVNYKVEYDSSTDTYIRTNEVVEMVAGAVFEESYTTTGEEVLSGLLEDDTEVYYCVSRSEEGVLVEGVTLSVYRREFDGSFVELATDLENSRSTYITDPHPALDFARYRIVAITTSTGAVGYYDVPGYPIGESAVIIQWDEEWTKFNTTTEDALEQPPWSGSLLKLPYNIDVSDKNSVDVAHVKYIGRENPVAYYGTQIGQTSTWNVVIPKSDKDTLYAIRRLSKWMGDVYVREPSGSGYWASVSVSYNQKHRDLTIPISFDITRVEGGI